MTVAQNRFDVHIQPLLDRAYAVVDRVVDYIAVGGVGIEFVADLIAVEEGDGFAAEVKPGGQIVADAGRGFCRFIRGIGGRGVSVIFRGRGYYLHRTSARQAGTTTAGTRK